MFSTSILRFLTQLSLLKLSLGQSISASAINMRHLDLLSEKHRETHRQSKLWPAKQFIFIRKKLDAFLLFSHYAVDFSCESQRKYFATLFSSIIQLNQRKQRLLHRLDCTNTKYEEGRVFCRNNKTCNSLLN